MSHRKPRSRAETRNQAFKDRLEVLKTHLEAVAIVRVNVNEGVVEMGVV